MSYHVYRPRINQYLLVAVDVFMLLAGFTLLSSLTELNILQNKLFLSVWVALVVSISYVSGRYRKQQIRSAPRLVGTIISIVCISALLSYPFMSGFDRQRILMMLIFMAYSGIALYIVRTLLFDHIWSSTKRRLVFLPDSVSAKAVFTRMQGRLSNNYDELKTIDAAEFKSTASWVKNNLDAPGHISSDNRQYDVIVYDPIIEQSEDVAKNLLVSRIAGGSVVDLIDFFSNVTGRLPLELINEQWLLRHSRNRHATALRQRLKRGIDLLVGVVALAVLALPILVIAILIRFDSPGPVIFKQERLGQNRKSFTIYKFRSMRLDAESDGPKWATQNDSRTTRIGNFLRKSHLDELPQLFNLIRGDISLIGPRPIRQHFADKLASQFELFDFRFLVRPGLTGWAQVLGPYGSTVDEQRIKLELDLYYIHEGSIVSDLTIIVKTIEKMGSSLVPEFWRTTYSSAKQ